MSKLICWLTGHQWLLQVEQPIAYYAENEKTAESYYYYECQRCNTLSRHKIVHLDNAPEEKIDE